MRTAIPILHNHDPARQVGVMENSIVTFTDLRPTREELFAILGNCGFRVMRMSIDDAGIERFERVEIMEFSYTPK